MSEHTPGPWTATDNTHLNGAWWIEFDSFCSIAEVRNGADDGWDGKPYPGTPEANARLIAAAPELLAALVEILGPLNVCSDNPHVRDDQVLPVDMTMGELRKARAAISKATGVHPHE